MSFIPNYDVKRFLHPCYFNKLLTWLKCNFINLCRHRSYKSYSVLGLHNGRRKNHVKTQYNKWKQKSTIKVSYQFKGYADDFKSFPTTLKSCILDSSIFSGSKIKRYFPMNLIRKSRNLELLSWLSSISRCTFLMTSFNKN